MHQLRSRKAFTLVEIMTVVALLGFIIAIVVPTFFRARELSRKRACQESQHKVDGAKQTWALEMYAPRTATPTWVDLVGSTKFIKASPTCPAGGTYLINAISEAPACSFSNQAKYPHEFEVEVGKTQ